MSNDRARGALLGLAVGDALGTTLEFARMDQPAYPALATGPATDVVGKGPFDLAPGMVTDDTQLAVCLARVLARHGRIDDRDLRARYLAWREHAFDVGNQTHASIARFAEPRPGFAVWRAADRRPAGNGSLMRSAPIGVALRGDGLLEAAIADSMLTHADPRCVLACCAFDAAIAAYIDGRDAFGAARNAIGAGARMLAAQWAAFATAEERACIEPAAGDLYGDLDAAASPDPGVYGERLDVNRTAGFVRVAFRLAFWHAAHTPSWKAALIDVASRGGDADTNAAIAGALLGARDGAEAIPVEWELRVLGAMLPGPAAWIDAHHPRLLFALL